MAITPTEALGNKLLQEAEAIKKMDQYVANQLIAKYNGRGSVTMGTNGYAGFVIQKVLEMYRAKGWECKLCSEQRDGTWLEFKPREGGSYYDN